MNKSEQISELAAALAKAQGAMEGVIKASTNPFFKSRYADLAAVVNAVRAPFSANGLSFVQLPRVSGGEGVIIETVLLHASGQWISSEIEVPVAKGDAQGVGSAITYAKRYGLQAMAGLAAEDEDDDGNSAAKAKPRATEAQMMPTPKGPVLDPEPAQGPRHGPEGTPHPRLHKFVIAKANYATAGMTEPQMRASFDLVRLVNERYGKGKAEGVLKDEFGVVSRSDLDEAQAERFLVRLAEMKEAE